MYGGAWTGPPSAIFSQNNQTNALSALVSAITIPPFDSTGGSTSTVSGAPPSVSVSPVSTTMKSESRGSRVAAIVGSVLGALVLMAIVFGIWFRRRRQQMRSLPLRESGAVTTVETIQLRTNLPLFPRQCSPYHSPTCTRIGKVQSDSGTRRCSVSAIVNPCRRTIGHCQSHDRSWDG
ncbi:hypothetical protein B0H10DRAFT_1263149 [Mycena sp. CBHHK59/15]|nr:hypothetical protein B0H10DRAFT_1263149 [Mycena sp. CBHHK59/15]